MVNYVYCANPVVLVFLAVTLCFCYRTIISGKKGFSLLNTAAFISSVYTVLYPTLLNRLPADRHLGTKAGARSVAKFLYDGEIYRQMFMNALLFAPFGFFLALLLAKKQRRYVIALEVIVCAAVLSGCIELVQYFTGLGKAEVTDIVMNTTGAAFGCAMALIPLPFLNYKDHTDES